MITRTVRVTGTCPETGKRQVVDVTLQQVQLCGRQPEYKVVSCRCAYDMENSCSTNGPHCPLVKKLRSKNFRMDFGGIEQRCRRFQPIGMTLTHIRAVTAWLRKVHWLLRASALMCCHEMPGCTMHCNSGERYGIFRHIFTPPFLWYRLYSPSVGLQRGHRWGRREPRQ